MKGKLLLIHNNAFMARSLASGLRAGGWKVDVSSGDGHLDQELARSAPALTAVLIDLSGRLNYAVRIARLVREQPGTSYKPTIFLGGTPNAVAQVSRKIPGAIFATLQELSNVLETSIAQEV